MSEVSVIPPMMGSPMVSNHGSSMYDREVWEHTCRMAKAFAESALVPKHFQGKMADVIVALAVARDLGENPLTFLQSIHIVHGVAGFSSKWLIARVNSSSSFRGRLRFRVEDRGTLPNSKLRDLRVTAYATDAETGEEVAETVTMAQALAEGWTKNEKYHTMPEVMLRYRAATFFVRFNCPELLYGMRTSDELDDIGMLAVDAPVAIEAAPTKSLASLAAIADAEATKPSPAEGQPELVAVKRPARAAVIATTNDDGVPE
jgi:hypothetical protein